MNAPTRSDVLRTIDLSHQATLVRVKIGKWSPYAFDANGTKDAYGNSGAGRANKHLMKQSKRVADTIRAFTEIGLWHNSHSGAWLDDGFRMVLTENLQGHMTELRRLTNVANAALMDLSRNWEDEIEVDKQRFERIANESGKISAFDINDYPRDIASKFYVEVRPMPVPNGSHFAQSVHEEERELFAKAMEEAVANADTKAAEEIGTVILPLVNRLTEYKGEKGQKFHKSLIDNVLDLAQRFRYMNVTGNENLTKLVVELEGMAQSVVFDHEILKENQGARDNAKAKLDKIMAKMGAFMGGENG